MVRGWYTTYPLDRTADTGMMPKVDRTLFRGGGGGRGLNKVMMLNPCIRKYPALSFAKYKDAPGGGMPMLGGGLSG